MPVREGYKLKLSRLFLVCPHILYSYKFIWPFVFLNFKILNKPLILLGNSLNYTILYISQFLAHWPASLNNHSLKFACGAWVRPWTCVTQ